MKATVLNLLISLSVGLSLAQHPLKQELKNTSYPKQGNDHLKKEWNNSPGGIIQSSDNTDEYVIENKQAYVVKQKINF